MKGIISLAWAEKVRQLLEADPGFRKDARVLSGTLYLYDEHGGVSFRFDRGLILDVFNGPDSRGSDFRLGGPREAWHQYMMGEADIHEATAGELTLEGDQVRVFGNALAFMRLWNSLKRATSEQGQ